SVSGRHTGRSDIPLTANGEAAAQKVADRLAGLSFSAVWSSPSQRARNTCALAGFGSGAVIKDDLAEWDYGAYEGITTKEILAGRPGWQLFRDGCPNGEFAADVGARADAVIHALREAAGTIL
ncbi:histidine phosphatase family protein, partial [Rhizobium ruizarguesonis]